jgi:metallo-beta-lactamase class B
MERKTFISLLVMLLCLGWVFSMTAMAQSPIQDPAKLWIRSGPYKLLDTDKIKAQMDIARQLAGDDWYFLQLQRLQCNDIDDTYTIVGPPGVNMGAANGWYEVPAVPTKVFDNVYYVGGMEVGGWLIDTGDGYIMLDAGYDYAYEAILKPNIEALGLDYTKVKYILITHSGPDHVGAAKKFQGERGAANLKVIYDSTINGITVTLKGDGDTLTLGDTTITMVKTPRTVGGSGLSYFIPVKVHGKRHMWATYGNTGINPPLASIQVYLDSMAKWFTYVDNLKPDIAISSHPFVDGSIRRMELIRECDDPRTRNDLCGPHNPFLIGQEAARTYFEIMNQCAVVRYEREAAGLNNTGTGLLP